MKKRNLIPIIFPVLLLLLYSIYATKQLRTPDFSVIVGVPAVSESGSTTGMNFTGGTPILDAVEMRTVIYTFMGSSEVAAPEIATELPNAILMMDGPGKGITNFVDLWFDQNTVYYSFRSDTEQIFCRSSTGADVLLPILQKYTKQTINPRKNPGSTADPEAQKLHLQYEPGSSSPSLIVHSDTLNGHYEGNLFFVGLQNVTIRLDGTDSLLETAIREGDISVEEIVAYARVDARNGFCTEKEHTENGLSQFTYDYGDYRINTIDDVYETPDGQSHRIKTFAVMAATVVENESYGFFYEGNGEIDREDLRQVPEDPPPLSE